ncbi:autotransporter domain-containing protein [Pusillimonas sp. T7-7]|uniref:autotransporter domain-containing protein n=1 Tax=Pusillimonas sp. (strain T7-7) TaxID=1007105 RepID=UPI00130548B8|nr:autotransporter domain-containing protein [Pusillimonas sp. T7-7]
MTEGSLKSLSSATSENHALVVDGNGSTFIGNKVDITTAGAHSVHSRGVPTHAIKATNGATVELTGGSVATTGAFTTHGIFASSNSHVTATDVAISTTGYAGIGVRAYSNFEMGTDPIQDQSITLRGGSINTKGAESYGMFAQDNGSKVIGEALDAQRLTVTTEGKNAFGVAVFGWASADLTDVDIITGGEGAKGVILNPTGYDNVPSGKPLFGAALTMNGSSITTSGKAADGVFVTAGSNDDDTGPSTASLTNTSITVTGENANGIYVLDGSQVTITGSTISTGTQSTMADGQAVGLWVGKKDSYAKATDVAIIVNREKNNSAGVEAKGENGIADSAGKVDLVRGSVTTYGLGNMGLLAYRGKITTEDTIIETFGDKAKGANASAELRTADNVIAKSNLANVKLVGGTVTTHGKEAHGLQARMKDSSIDANAVSVKTSGEGAYGANAYNGGVAALTNVSVLTAGNNAHGLNLDGWREEGDNKDLNDFDISGTSITMNGGSIVTTGTGSAGVHLKDSSTVVLNNVRVETNNASIKSQLTQTSQAQTITVGAGSDLTKNNGTLLHVNRTDPEGLNGIVNLTISGTGTMASGDINDEGGNTTFVLSDNAQWTGRLLGVDDFEILSGASFTETSGTVVLDTLTMTDGVKVAFTNGVTVSSTEESAVVADDHATIALTGGTVTNGRTSGSANGLLASNNATITGTNVTIVSGGESTPGATNGVLANYDGYVNLTGGSVKSNSSLNGRGLSANYNGKIDTNGVAVSTTGEMSHAVQAWSLIKDDNGGVPSTDRPTIKLTGGSVNTVGADSYGLMSQNNGSYISAESLKITTTGANSYGAVAYNGAEVVLTNVDVATSGAGSHGISMGETSTAQIPSREPIPNVASKISVTGGSIVVTGANSTAVNLQDSGTVNLNDVRVESTGASIQTKMSQANQAQTITVGAGSDLTKNNGTLMQVTRTTDGADGTIALNLQSGSFLSGNVLDKTGDKKITVTKASDAYWAGIVIDKNTKEVPDGGSQDYGDEEIDGSVASGEGSTVTFNNGANITGSVSSGANSTSTFSGSTSIGGDVAGQQGSTASFGGATTIGGSVTGSPSSNFVFSGPSTNIGGSVAGSSGSAFSFSGPTTIGGNVAGEGASFNFSQSTPTTITGNVGLNNGSSIHGGSTGTPIQISGNAQVGSGSTLGGNLNIAGMVSGSGTLGPGNSIGVQTYGSLGEFTGDYVAEVNAAGQSDLIKIASGDADLRGINLTVGQEDGNGGYRLNHDYTIVETTKADGISAVAGNKFASEALDSSFDGTLVKLDAAKFGANTVQISLSADTSAIDAIRKDLSSNQNATLDGVISVAGQNASADAALQSSDPKDALNQLSGELHASTQTAMLNNSQLVTRTLSNRMRANLGAGMQAGAPTAQASGAVAGSMPTSGAYPLWAQVVGSWNELDDDGNAAKVKSDTAGLFIGADTAVGQGWRVGAALGFTDGEVKVNDRNSKSDVTSYTAALYGGNSWKTAKGQVNFLAGAAYTTNEVDSRRTVNVGGSQTLKADYDVNTTQLFTELGYAIPVGQASVVEPYLGVAWMSQKAKSFDESGGSAALHGDSQTDDVTTFTLGLRGATTITTGKSEARLTAGLGWRHAAGDVDATRSMSFIQGAGDAFSIAGAPIAKNAAVVDLGAEMNVGKNTALGLSYSGQFGDGASDNAGTVYVRVRF